MIEVQVYVCVGAVKTDFVCVNSSQRQNQNDAFALIMNFLSQDKKSRRQADNEGDENERGGGEICKKVS